MKPPYVVRWVNITQIPTKSMPVEKIPPTVMVQKETGYSSEARTHSREIATYDATSRRARVTIRRQPPCTTTLRVARSSTTAPAARSTTAHSTWKPSAASRSLPVC